MTSNDEKREGSEESDSGDENIPIGTKREFTVDVEHEKLFWKFNLTNLVTERLPHVIVRTKSGVLAAGMIFQRWYWDKFGLYEKGETWVAADRLGSLEHKAGAQLGKGYECKSSDGEGTVTVYSREPLDGKYWVRQLLGTHNGDCSPCSTLNGSIPRVIRQMKCKTLDGAKGPLNAKPLSILAYFSRGRIRANLKGNVSHAFFTSLGNPSESLYVSPFSRSQLEGVTLLRLDNEDYSLVTGKRVRYELAGEVYHVVDEGGSVDIIDDEALVG